MDVKRARPARAAQIQAASNITQAFHAQQYNLPFSTSSLSQATASSSSSSQNGSAAVSSTTGVPSKGKRSMSEEPLTTNSLPAGPPQPLTPDSRLGMMRRFAPLIYDSILHHNLDWGSLSVCWGAEVIPVSRLVIVDGSNYTDEFNFEQTFYFAGRTDGDFNSSDRTWKGSPGELFVGQVAIAKPRTTQRNAVGKFQENKRSSRVAVAKRIIHPGEVNKIRALPAAPHMIVTHTDSPIVYVWNTRSQPDRKENMSTDDSKNATSASQSSNNTGGGNSSGGGKKKTGVWLDVCPCSVPDFELMGHTEPAEYALDTKGQDSVLSGGADKMVLLWSLTDASTGRTQIEPRMRFVGHTATVEDVAFRPLADAARCCSVGQDRSLFLWESRSLQPTHKKLDIHEADANCCAWSTGDMILTGGSDGVVNVWDTRKLEKPVVTVSAKSSVINVRWSPDDANAFLFADETSTLSIARLNEEHTKASLLFDHLGHRTAVVDAQFNPLQPWTVASVSDDSADESRGGGGSLQIWRVSEFVYKTLSDKEWAAEIEQAYIKSTKEGEDVSEDDAGPGL